MFILYKYSFCYTVTAHSKKWIIHKILITPMFYESNLLELCIFKNVYNYKHIDVNYDVIPHLGYWKSAIRIRLINNYTFIIYLLNCYLN